MNNLILINTDRPHLYSPDIHVGMSVELDKAIDDSEILRAIKALEHRHPLLTSTIYFDDDKNSYYNLNTADAITPEITNNDTTPWQDVITNSNKTPFDLTHDTLMRIYINKTDISTRITVLGHHLLGDGLSFIYFIIDFLSALDNKPDDKVLYPAIINIISISPKKDI